MPRLIPLTIVATLAVATACTTTTQGDAARATARPHPTGTAQISEEFRADLSAVRGAFRDLRALLQHHHSDATYAAAAAPIVAAFAREKSRLSHVTPPAGLGHQFTTVRAAVDEGLSAARAVAAGAVNGSSAEQAHLATLLHRISGHADALQAVAARTAGTGSGSSSADLTRTTWSAASYPFDCAPVGYVVERVRYADLNGDGALDAVVLVRCDAGAGNPPAALYAFDGASSAAQPHVMATLISPATDRLASDFTIAGTTVAIEADGYSSQNVPRCCPDEKFQMSWHWHGSTYTAESRRMQ